MAYVDLQYGRFSFEENPGLITWIQLFLIKVLRETEDRPAWTDQLIAEWKLNSLIEIYKYIFDEKLLDDSGKIGWGQSFLAKSIERMNEMSLLDFSTYIGQEISPLIDFARLKRILFNLKLMLEGMEPLATS